MTKSTKTSSKKTTVTAKAFLHWPAGSTAYDVHKSQSREGKLITVAAMIVSGMAKLNKTGLGKATGKGNPKLFKSMVGPTPYNFHKRAQRFTNDNTLTSVGVQWFDQRMRNDEDRELVRQAVAAFQKGGKVEGLAVEFKRQIEVA